MSDSNSTLTAERLREVLSYDPETGEFTRAITLRKWKSGQRAGSLNKVTGYIYIMVDGYSSTGHRLAWLYMTGNWPIGSIDHKDGVRSNNRFANLRDVQHLVNMQNRQRAQTDNKLGILGVTHRRGRYRATLKHLGKSIYLGDYKTAEEAHAAYLTAKRVRHEGNTL